MKISDLLNEGIESTITDYNVAQLQKLFNIINRKAFNGELPPVKIKINTAKVGAGIFTYSRKIEGSNIVEMHVTGGISISKFKEFDAGIVAGILAHEMIHYKIMLDAVKNLPVNKAENEKQQNHGIYFKKFIKHVGMTTGLTQIPIKETQSRNIKPTGKKHNVMAFVNSRGDADVITITKKLYKELISGSILYYQSELKTLLKDSSYTNIILGTSDNINLNKLTTTGTFSTTPKRTIDMKANNINMVKRITK